MPDHADRTYLHVRPTTASLRPPELAAAARRLHDVLFPDTLLEVLLVARADDADYYLGIHARHASSVESILRDALPDSYEFTERAPRLPSTDRDAEASACTLQATADRRKDWQTRLTPVADLAGEEEASYPLDGVADALATAPGPAVFQALLRPHEEWRRAAETRQEALRHGQDTLGQHLLTAVAGAPDPERNLPRSVERRIADLEARDVQNCFVVTARVVAWADHRERAARTVDAVAAAFGHVGGDCHRVQAIQVENTQDILDAIRSRTVHDPAYASLASYLPWTENASQGIVADAGEAPAFLALDGATLSTEARRALDAVSGERTALPRPAEETLARYRGDGLPLGHPRTGDAESDPDRLVLPPALQRLHVGWFGQTGSGKSTALINGILDNQAATAGLDLLVDPKGDGMAADYLAAHHARHGDLEDVLYFDCTELLPAISFFDIRPDLDAGVPRETAVADVAAHYVDILRSLMGTERFERAVRSPDVIRYLVRAMFDPGTGADAFTQTELADTARRMRSRQEPPPVADPRLEGLLEGVTEDDDRTFERVMGGVVNRIEAVSVDRRVASLFDHVAGAEGPAFDLRELLDEDRVVVIDTGGLRDDAQHAVTLVVLSALWSALRQRAAETDGETRPLVNCYLEEAAAFADTDLLSDLLARSRAFDCSVTLAMQYPGQLRAAGGQGVYEELLNNVATVVTGQVPSDDRLAQRLATDDMPPDRVGNRLRALARGEWLVSLPAPFDAEPPRPFLVQSLAEPPGGGADIEDSIRSALGRTGRVAGRTLTEPTADTDSDRADGDEADRPARLTTALPYTRRMPRTVEYDSAGHALRCIRCDSRYDPTGEGIKRAVTCCASLEDVDRDDVPVCEVHLKLGPEERAATGYSDRQLQFLQAVYDAQAGTFTELEYDLLRDSMLRLQEYLGITDDAVEKLLDDGLLRHDGDRPHRLYTVTSEGRTVIQEPHHHGVDYGHGKGDLSESSLHALVVELGRRHLVAEFRDDPESAVDRVVPYYDVDSGDAQVVDASAAMGGGADALEQSRSEFEARRLDVAGLDEQGAVAVALEVELINNDVHRAAPKDFDTMAACEPAEAIWLVMSNPDAHTVLQALNDPPEGPIRVEKEYSESTRAYEFSIDEPGLTEMVTFGQIYDEYVE